MQSVLLRRLLERRNQKVHKIRLLGEIDTRQWLPEHLSERYNERFPTPGLPSNKIGFSAATRGELSLH
jgi:hypothetical protein